MISSYFTDLADIVTVSTDTWGVKSEVTQSNIKCRIEDMNRLIQDDKGQEVMASILGIFPYSTEINYGDKLIVKKKSGITFEQEKKFIIKRKSVMAMFKAQYYEVYA